MNSKKYKMLALCIVALWATYAFGNDSVVAPSTEVLAEEDQIALAINRRQPISTKAAYYAVAGWSPKGTMASADYKIGDQVEVCNLVNKLCIKLTVTERIKNPKDGRTVLLPEPDMALLNGLGSGYIDVTTRLIKGVDE